MDLCHTASIHHLWCVESPAERLQVDFNSCELLFVLRQQKNNDWSWHLLDKRGIATRTEGGLQMKWSHTWFTSEKTFPPSPPCDELCADPPALQSEICWLLVAPQPLASYCWRRTHKGRTVNLNIHLLSMFFLSWFFGCVWCDLFLMQQPSGQISLTSPHVQGFKVSRSRHCFFSAGPELDAVSSEGCPRWVIVMFTYIWLHFYVLFKQLVASRSKLWTRYRTKRHISKNSYQ